MLFEKASRMKLRFQTAQGLVSVEDLWDIPLTHRTRTSLDDIAKGLFKGLKETETESFVVKAPKKDDDLQLAFDVVKHIIDVRLAEQEKAQLAQTNREKKQQLLAIIAQKETEQLAGSSLDELKAMVESLG